MISAQTIWKRIFSSAVLCGLILSVGQPTLRADARPQTQTGPKPIVMQAVKFGLSTLLSELPDRSGPQSTENQETLNSSASGSLMPAATGWEGISNEDNFQVSGIYVNPPDVSGDIGPGHYIQTVNNLFEIWNPVGVWVHGPALISGLFTGFGGMCETHNDGEPVVLYDQLADRWLISQVAKDDVAPGFDYHQCVAISSTPNPDPVLSPWYLYDFQILNTSADMYAAPKIGVWPDGYYMTFDQLNYNGATFDPAGQGVAVLDREQMLAGQNARLVYFDLLNTNSDLSRMLPADLDGPPPPAGTPGYFVQIDDDGHGGLTDQLQIWALDSNWTANTWAFGDINKTLVVDAFDSNLCNYSLDCIPQPGASTNEYLDAKSDRLMYRLQYRYQDGIGHMVVNHTVDSGLDRAGIHWYHLQIDSSGAWIVGDQGTYAPGTDSDHRWMGSAAMDVAGNIAVGYSVSSSTTFPSIRIAGRLTGDPAGELSQGEASIVDGTGYQNDPASRWGDYSMMTVDPVDQCTFWYTTEYIATTNADPLIGNWQTKIAKFNFGAGNCSAPPTYTISGAVTDQALVPIANASVTTDTGYFATTGADGIYTLSGLPAGDVTVTVAALGYLIPVSQVISITNASVFDVNFILTGSDKDDFDGALVIGSVPYMHTANTTTATQASDDPLITDCNLDAGRATIWFKYTSPSSRPIYIDTYGSDYNTFVAVWRGSRGDLTPIVCNDDAGSGVQSAVVLPAENDTYYIEVGQSGADTLVGGNLQFHLATFADVPGNYWAWRYIEGLYKAGVTGGCVLSPKQYCPGASVTRDQMAVFLLRAKHGPNYAPPPATGVFADVPITFWAAAWIEQLAAEGITGGCLITPKLYCPTTPVTRDQMAVFLMLAKHGVAFNPPDPIGVFADVPVNYWAARWIEQLAAEQITGGCGSGNYCPATPVTRDQMAVFLVRAMSLPLVP